MQTVYTCSIDFVSDYKLVFHSFIHLVHFDGGGKAGFNCILRDIFGVSNRLEDVLSVRDNTETAMPYETTSCSDKKRKSQIKWLWMFTWFGVY